MIDNDAVPYNTEILYFSESPLNVHHVCKPCFCFIFSFGYTQPTTSGFNCMPYTPQQMTFGLNQALQRVNNFAFPVLMPFTYM